MSKAITVKVTPNAKKNEVVQWEEGILYVKIKGIPEKGKVNEELIAFLAKEWRIKKGQIEIKTGHTARIKRIEVTGAKDAKNFKH